MKEEDEGKVLSSSYIREMVSGKETVLTGAKHPHQCFLESFSEIPEEFLDSFTLRAIRTREAIDDSLMLLAWLNEIALASCNSVHDEWKSGQEIECDRFKVYTQVNIREEKITFESIARQETKEIGKRTIELSIGKDGMMLKDCIFRN